MLQGQGLGAGADVDLVDADHVAHTQGGNADLLLGALAFAGTAAVGHGLGTGFLDGIEQHQGGAAGGIHLAVVVYFHNLDVRIGEENGSLLCKAAQHRDAKAHVAGIENGDLLGGGVNQFLFLRGVTGGADDSGAAIGLGIGQHVRNGGMVGKVDQHIGRNGTQFLKSLGNTVFTVDADTADNFAAEDAIDQLAHGAVGAAQNRSHTSIPSFLISAKRTALVASSMGVRGRRRKSAP